MVNIFPSVQPSRKKKDGTFPIRIGIYANNQTRYISSDVFIHDLSQFSDGMIINHPESKTMNTILRKLINKIYYQIDNIEYSDDLTASEIVAFISEKGPLKPRTLRYAYEEYISTARVKDSTRRLITTVYGTIEKCFGKNVSLASLTYAHVMRYEKSLRDAGNSNGTIRTKMAIFSKIVKYAVKARLVKYECNPFSEYKYPVETVRQAWLTVEETRKLRDAKLKGAQATLRDYIILSYYLGGINAIDLFKINFKEIEKTGVIKFVRTKTENMSKINKYISFTIPKEAWPVINRLMAEDGHLGTTFHRKGSLHDFYAQAIHGLRNRTGLKNLVYYSARKSFSQHAFELGINTDVIDYILGHKIDKGGSSLFNYIVITPEIATDAIRKVLDNLK